MIEGVSQVVVDVEDRGRALRSWTGTMEFELAQDAPYGEAERWIEVGTRDRATTPVLRLRQGDRPTAPEELSTSNFALHPREATWIAPAELLPGGRRPVTTQRPREASR